jgi:hypothetical protein
VLAEAAGQVEPAHCSTLVRGRCLHTESAAKRASAELSKPLRDRIRVR